MNNWLDRFDPSKPFLFTRDRVWTYGESAAEVASRRVDGPATLTPGLDPDAVFDVLAAVFSGGAMVSSSLKGDPRGAALVVPTSGTTGVPKGVRLTLPNLEAAATASAAHLGHGEDDVWLLSMSLSHVAGLSILIRQAWTGGSVFMLSRFDPVSVWEAVAGSVTMVSVVPTMLHRMLNVGGQAAGMRAVLVGGGPIPNGLLERARDRGLPVLPTYGMTETFGQIATLRPDAPLAYKVHPLPGVDIRIDDGRVSVRGDQVSFGYLGEPDRVSEWLSTNDLGEMDDEGALRILGRADTVIITGGQNVSPERVEAELSEHAEVQEAVVVGLPDEEWGDRVACAYVGEAEPADLADWLKERLAGFMIPRSWAKLDSIPRSPIGKPDRASVSAVLSSEAE